MSFKPYKSYNFKDKDPIIDTLRTIVQDSGASYRDIQETSGVSTSCLWNWFQGKTRRPSYAAVCAVARSCGHDLEVKRISGKVVQLRRKRA